MLWRQEAGGGYKLSSSHLPAPEEEEESEGEDGGEGCEGKKVAKHGGVLGEVRMLCCGA